MTTTQTMAAKPDPEVLAKGKRRSFTAEYKSRILAEADRCKHDGEIGALLRREGLYSFEDKVLQRAVAMVLEAVYEQDFLDFSYAYRPGRSAHQATASIREGMMRMRGGWVLEVDIAGFFEELDHGHLRTFVRRRVRDGVLLRLIGKWLKAGVMEEGSVRRTSAGTPQGGVISPLLANLYLYEVFDRWFEDVVRPRLRGWACVVRYADDIAIAFSDEHDARRVLDILSSG